MDLFVYYEVAHQRVELVRERVRALHAAVGGDARLMKRADVGADVETWMEVYPNVDADFAVRLGAAVEQSGVAALTGPRHVERFVDVV